MVTDSIVFLLFRYQSCYHFGWPKVTQYVHILYWETKLVLNSLLIAVFGLVVRCTKSSPRSLILPRRWIWNPLKQELLKTPSVLFFLYFFFSCRRTSNVIVGSKRKHSWQWKDSTSYDMYDYASELLYFLLVTVLLGTFQFHINFARTGQWKARDFEFWWG